MIFRQLLDPETSTYTYLLADSETREAVLIDPVLEQLDRDTQLLQELELQLRYSLETHVHADHVTAGGLLRQRLGCQLGVGAHAGVYNADLALGDGDALAFGRHALQVRSTPGHTSGCVTYVCPDAGMAFTGDALLIRACGRTDFQQGSAAQLYDSVHSKVFTLPDDTLLYPGHDYKGRTVSTVAEEKHFNARLGGGRARDAFVETMAQLNLAYPQRIDEAVPANMESGLVEPEPVTRSTAPEDGWAPLGRTPAGVPVVPAEWVEAHRKQLHLVDVREHIEFSGPLGHLEGAELVPLAGLERAARAWGREVPLITVCRSGGRSGRAALRLAELGFTRVAALEGGLTRWVEEGRATVDVLAGRERQDAEAVWLGLGI